MQWGRNLTGVLFNVSSSPSFFGKHFERIDIILDVDIKAEVRFDSYFAGGFHIRMQVCKSEFAIARIICPSQ